MAINSTDPAYLAPPAEAGRFHGLANNGAAGAAAATGLLRLVVDQGDGVAPGLGYTASSSPQIGRPRPAQACSSRAG